MLLRSDLYIGLGNEIVIIIIIDYFLVLFIITAILFTFQLYQDCLHMVRGNEVARRILSAIADSLSAVENVGSLLAPECTVPPVDDFT